MRLAESATALLPAVILLHGSNGVSGMEHDWIRVLNDMGVATFMLDSFTSPIEADSSLEKIVSAPVILAEEADFSGMNEEWIKWFPSDPPARQGAKLRVRVAGLKISIAATAEA